MRTSLLALALTSLPLAAARQQDAAKAAANPIRKVVTMLQAMQTKVTEEGAKEKELYDKFMCFCKTSGGDLGKSIEEAETKIPMVGSDIKSAEEQKVQVSEELKQAQSDRSAAKSAMKEATGIRDKEAAAYAAEKAESTTNIDAINKAVAALSKGMAGAFVQTASAQTLKRLLEGKHAALIEDDRQEQLLAFLSGTQGTSYAPQSGEITGILKTMGDEMSKGLADATATEESAIESFGALMAAKKKEVEVLTAAIESKMAKVGELGVSIVQMKNDLTDTEEGLLADKEFQANLEKGCKTKTAEWEERSKTRADELVALADTIKVLNDDDALELFKKTLPGAASSFLQLTASTKASEARALQLLRDIRRANPADITRIDLITLALRGKKAGFEKVVKMIDGMVVNLKKEQDDDDHKKEYCHTQFDQSDDKKKALERLVEDKETAIESTQEAITKVKEEIESLKAGIKALDKEVAEATEQRKVEHSDFTELMASNSAAKELLAFAKNRLNKFYNPKLYKPPPKRELSREDRIAVNMGGEAPPTEAPGGIAGTGIAVLAQVRAHAQRRDAPPPPPETFGAYSKKSEEGTGVIAMIDLLVKDLDKEMTEAETSEKDSQADYETMMKDSAEKRTKDSKSLSGKTSTKADLEGALETYQQDKTSAKKELGATLEYIHSLHSECDWLLKYFDVRKEARASEIDSLAKAKAVLNGADFSLLQTRTRGFLESRA